MGKLINEWVTESILTEDIKKTVVTYVGRFHPFHEGHNAVYQHLVKKFGKDNVYIGTSDKVELPKSPFRFKEKVEIMTTMFGIPKNKIYQVKNPYAPKEILQSFSEETTAFVTVVGKKDAGRLRMGDDRYFSKYEKGKVDKGFADKGYVYIVPPQGKGISGTQVRAGMSEPDEQKRMKFFKSVYPKFNQKIFDLVSSKILRSEEVMESFLQYINNK
jgi:FAD synthase